MEGFSIRENSLAAVVDEIGRVTGPWSTRSSRWSSRPGIRSRGGESNGIVARKAISLARSLDVVGLKD